MSLFKKYYAKYLIYYIIYNVKCIYKHFKNYKLKNTPFSTGPWLEPVLKGPENFRTPSEPAKDPLAPARGSNRC